MTVTFNSASILSWYSAKEGTAAPATTSSSSSSATPPTPPWQSKVASAQPSALATAALNGQSFINPSATQLNITDGTTTQNANYKNLFALYQGVTALSQLATQAGSTTVTASQLKSIQTAFNSGVSQLKTFLASAPFSGLTVNQGAVVASDTATVTQPHETDTYQTGPVFTGSLSSEVPSLQGDVAFSVSVKGAGGKVTNVSFNLNDLGSTPRTLPNVITYLNSQLKAAGLTTRFSDVRIPATAQTVTSGGKTYTIPAGADSYALKITGTSSEQLTFKAPTSTPSVTVAQTSGVTTPTETVVGNKVTTVAATDTQVLTALSVGTPASSTATSQIYNKTLASVTTGAVAQATGPDGSLYTLSTDAGKGPTGKALPGPQNVVLTKYDSTGQVEYARDLGSLGSATGYSIAVSPDGGSVAIAGSVTGTLTPTDGTITAGQSDTFVASYNASTGDNNWITRAGTPNGNDNPIGIAFGANGAVYVAGDTSAAFSGQSLKGTQDGFIQAFSSKGVANAAQEFGSGGVTTVGGIAVSGSNVTVASTENGSAVVRTFGVTGTDTLTASNVRNLGSLDGGNVAGVTVNADGSIIVAGSTHNASLSAGTITNAYSGGREAFVASLAANGQPSGSDTLAYYSPGGNATTTAVTASGGQVYIAGQVAGPPNAASQGQPSNEGFVAAINTSTGQSTWSSQLVGTAGQDLPTSLSVNPTGSSVLNAFGLPNGTINYIPSTSLVDNTSLMAGESFSVQVGSGSPTKITISSTDTLQTLASKITAASGNYLSATVLPTSTGNQLTIKPANSTAKVSLLSGPSGADALGPLGITAGVITDSATSKLTVSKTSNISVAPYGLGISSNLNLSTSTAISQAQSQLAQAQSVLKSIYIDMTTKPSTTKATTSSSGTVPAYLTSQISNYQTALNRLQAYNSSSGSSSTTSLLG